MKNNSDFIMRQVEQFADGLKWALNKGKASDTEIVFDQQQTQINNNLLDEINLFLTKDKFREAVSTFYKLKFELKFNTYLNVGEKLLNSLKKAPKCSPQLVTELEQSLQRSKKEMK
ncbi:hypothetical protein [Pediococcus pentosaceus]|uniref:hypothetical protein n=1 Tax=Pediococcus pentosaceus TaxID=1255 RepID=UPI0018A16EEB|nr:hypothetical protein [Pediococcus pentosaceus]MBF7128905.1 hypothetical protein [Pediococcus pentosaceus]MBF7131967.1 hypothetical protein [Pediococcus pentosaceus]